MNRENILQSCNELHNAYAACAFPQRNLDDYQSDAKGQTEGGLARLAAIDGRDSSEGRVGGMRVANGETSSLLDPLKCKMLILARAAKY
jgi:hypothetical protein